MTATDDFLDEDPGDTAAPAPSRGAGRHQNALSAKAYKAGERGEDFDEFRQQNGLADGHLELDMARAAFDQGAADAREKTRRPKNSGGRRSGGSSRSGRAARRSVGYLQTVGAAGRSNARSIVASPQTGGGSFAAVMTGVLLVIALFLLLSRANLATTLIGGVTKAASWLVAPKTLPF